MIDVSLVLCWPRHIDYPLFRYNLKRWRKYFKGIYIAVTQRAFDWDIVPFLQEDLPFVNFEFAPSMYDDWRNNAVRNIVDFFALSEYTMFLEQDFLMRDYVLGSLSDGFWEFDFLYYLEGTRFHPAFSIVKRDIIQQTQKDFSAHPPQYDHFGLFFEEINKKVDKDKKLPLEYYGFDSVRDYYHLGGLTQNYFCVMHGEPLYKPDEFIAYNTLSQSVPVKQFPPFQTLQEKITRIYGEGDHHSFLQPFFPKEK